MTISNWAICGTKNSRLFKNRKASRSLSHLGIRTQLSEISVMYICYFKDENILHKL